jgi:hypothetical protein
MCVKRKVEPKERSRELPGIRIPGTFPGSGAGGGQRRNLGAGGGAVK